MKNVNYQFWAGTGGREVTRRIRRFKKVVFVLSGVIVLETIVIAGLVSLYFKILNGGF